MKRYKYFLNEEQLSADVPNVEVDTVTEEEIGPKGPEQGKATGEANLLHDLLIKRHEAVQDYNNAIANLQDYPEIISTLETIAATEMTNIGLIEQALAVISPNAENITQGSTDIDEIETDINLGIHESIDDTVYMIDYDYVDIRGRYKHKQDHRVFKSYRDADYALSDILSDLEERGCTEVQGDIKEY